ncbi:MAG: hypothetical protein LBI99_06505 [Propionibacteriaceae bacterium]|jgi:hypothetical protein|nr:hypothetical protein [Propionibacteriaceae bacterium]
MKKRLSVMFIATVLSLSLVAPPAMAAQTNEEIDTTVASYDQLAEIVSSKVADAYAGVVSTVNSTVAGTLQSTIGSPAAVIDLAAPLIKAAVKGAVAQYLQDERIDAIVDAAVDGVAESELVNRILTNEFVQAVIARTIDYAVADIVASLGLDADQAATTANLLSQVWNAPRVSVGTAPTKVKSDLGSPIYALGVGVNTSYYSYNVTAWNQRRVIFTNVNDTPKEIVVTGWNSGNIGVLATATATVNATGKGLSAAEVLANLDYVEVIKNAALRALQDEIRIRIEAAILAAKTALLNSLQATLGKVGIGVTLDPADSWTIVRDKIAAAILDKTEAELQEILDCLPVVIPPGDPDESFFERLARIAKGTASSLFSAFFRINWIALFRGDSKPKPAEPSLTVKVDRKAMANTDTPAITIQAKNANGQVIAAAAQDAEISYSYGPSCQFPSGQAPSRRTCAITVEYAGMRASASVEVFDASALAGPINGVAAPRAKLLSAKPDGWPTVTYRWLRNGKLFSTASSYKLPSTEKVGNKITLTTSLSYQGLKISGTSPELTVALGKAGSLKLVPKNKAIANTGGLALTVTAKDIYGNNLPNAADGVVYSYSLGEGCTFPTGQAPSRRSCTVTGSLDGVSASAVVEVFDASALAGPISGVAAPKSKLSAVKPDGWPTVTYRWERNGKLFSTASSYTLPSTEKAGNEITLTISMSYQGLKISGTSPALTVAPK